MSVLSFYTDEVMFEYLLFLNSDEFVKQLTTLLSLPKRWSGSWSLLTKEAFQVLLNKQTPNITSPPATQQVEPDLGLVLTIKTDDETLHDTLLFPIELEGTLNAYTFVQVPVYTGRARKVIYSGLSKHSGTIKSIITFVVCVFDSGEGVAELNNSFVRALALLLPKTLEDRKEWLLSLPTNVFLSQLQHFWNQWDPEEFEQFLSEKMPHSQREFFGKAFIAGWLRKVGSRTMSSEVEEAVKKVFGSERKLAEKALDDSPDEVLKLLPPERMRVFTRRQVRGLSPEQLQGLSPEQLQGLSPEQLQGLSPEQVIALLSALPSDVVDAIPKNILENILRQKQQKKD